MRCEFAKESLIAIWDEFMPLAEMHWKETGQAVKGFESIPLAVNKDAYTQIDQSGHYCCFTARTNGLLVGYSTYMVFPHMQTGLMTALHDVLFVHPHYRGNGCAPGLLDFCKAQLIAIGARVEQQESPINPDLSPLFLRKGYIPVGKTFVRWL